MILLLDTLMSLTALLMLAALFTDSPRRDAKHRRGPVHGLPDLCAGEDEHEEGCAA